MDQEKFRSRLADAAKNGKLNLGFCELTSLPATYIREIRAAIPNLQELDVRSNLLSDLPPEIVELRTLRCLRLNYNKFEKFPTIVTQLPHLLTLEINGNGLQSLDPAISNCQVLKELDIAGNQLTSLPPSIGQLTSLTVLQAENNQLTALPDTIGDLRSLVKLDVSTNKLTTLPKTIGHLTSLHRLDVSSNQITTFPGTIGHMRNLHDINVRYNALPDNYKKKSEEGLGKFLDFLRSEEQRMAQEEIERLRPKPVQIGNYMEYRIKTDGKRVLDNGSIVDVGERTICYAHIGTTVTVGVESFWVHGGALADGTKTDDLFCMSLQRLAWEAPPQTGDVPTPRANHVAWFDDEEKRLYVFGGRGADRRRNNDFHMLDVATMTWKAVGAANPPSPRDRASCCVIGRQAVVFGGKGPKARLNDVHFFDLNAGTWSQATVSGTVPSPREGAAIAALDNKLYVFGGRNTFCLNDLFVLDVETLVWSLVKTVGHLAAPALHGAGMHFTKDTFLMLWGGFNEQGHTNNAFYRINATEPYVELERHHAEAGAEGGAPAEGADAAAKEGAPPPPTHTGPEWELMDSELGENPSRVYVWMPGEEEALCLLQALPETRRLAELRDDDRDQGGVSWDIYRHAKVADFKAAAVDSTSTKSAMNAKMSRIAAVESRPEKHPLSYRTNSSREEQLLRYVADWRAVCVQLYPLRRPLFLCPPNEFGVPKFVCTTVRPTKLAYPALHDWPGVARFVAEFITYETLENPLDYPARLPSPSAVIEWQAGDCFDVANVLASLLIGVGYDAYVVVGYAPRSVTLNNQSHMECHWHAETEAIAAAKAAAVKAAAAKKAAEAAAKAAQKYVVRKPVVLESQFLKDMENKRKEQPAPLTAEQLEMEQIRQARAEREAAGADDDIDLEDIRDVLRGHRVHAWVLLRAGKRDLAETFFIEPAMGRRFSVDKCPYEGIEFVWNHKNYWLNVQREYVGGVAGCRVDAGLSFDLDDHDKWEPVMDDDTSFDPSAFANGPQIELDPNSTHGQVLSYRRQSASRASPTPAIPIPPGTAQGARTGTADVAASPPTNGPPVSASFKDQPGAQQRVNTAGSNRSRTPSGRPKAVGARAGVATPRSDQGRSDADDLGDGLSEAPLAELAEQAAGVVSMPPSWVPKLILTQKQFDMRCPRGTRSTVYRKCVHDVFAHFGEAARWDGLLERLTLFQDLPRTKVKEIRETYARRADRLTDRTTDPMGVTVERFGRGAGFSLREIITSNTGRSRVTHYYPAARLDGLIMREETFQETLDETFEGRDDFLVHRHVEYAPLPAPGTEEDNVLLQREEGPRRGPAKKRKPTDAPVQPVRLVRDSFELRGRLPAHKALATRELNLEKGAIRLEFHYGIGRITADSREFFLPDGRCEVVQVDPLEAPFTERQLIEEWAAVQAAQAATLAAVRESEEEMREIQAARAREENAIVLRTPFYDVVRERVYDSDEEPEEEKKEAERDYLSGFLPAAAASRALTRNECLETRAKCLAALKERLLSRSAIMQRRFDSEQEALAKRMATYQRDRDQMTREDEIEYEKACEAARFRIRVLEGRIRRHEDEALQKYYDADARLRADPRLAALTEPVAG